MRTTQMYFNLFGIKAVIWKKAYRPKYFINGSKEPQKDHDNIGYHVVAPLLVKIITLNFAAAITLFPFVFYRSKFYIKRDEMRRYESIHIAQQIELLVIGFYILYLFFYLQNRFRKMNHKTAYREIPFEIETRSYENAYGYLEVRKKYAWTKYV